MTSPNFPIEPGKPLSDAFLKRNIHDFESAMKFVRELPYARNLNKTNLLCVFEDECGTCSTKHALLKELAIENNFKGVKLITGVFKMNATNSPLVKNTLLKYKLDYLPEAHNYLRYRGTMIDCTKLIWDSAGIERVIMEEVEILPGQVTEYKIEFHKNFLNEWLNTNKEVPYNLEELWHIREQCIKDLSE